MLVPQERTAGVLFLEMFPAGLCVGDETQSFETVAWVSRVVVHLKGSTALNLVPSLLSKVIIGRWRRTSISSNGAGSWAGRYWSGNVIGFTDTRIVHGRCKARETIERVYPVSVLTTPRLQGV